MSTHSTHSTTVQESTLLPGTDEHLRACAELLGAPAPTPVAVVAAACALIARDLRESPLRALAYDVVGEYGGGDEAYVSRR